MVIQRWQTVLLFIATVLMVVFMFVPMATFGEGELSVPVRPTHYPGYVVLNVVIALMLFISIFMYRNIKMQRRITIISILMIAVSAVTGGLYIYGPAGPSGAVEIVWTGGVLLLILACLFAIGAYRRIVADQKLLSSADRIR